MLVRKTSTSVVAAAIPWIATMPTGDVLLGGEGCRLTGGRAWSGFGRLPAGHPDAKHGESKQCDDQQQHERDPFDGVVVVREVDDPQDEAGRRSRQPDFGWAWPAGRDSPK
jgi:hypothetical protein